MVFLIVKIVVLMFSASLFVLAKNFLQNLIGFACLVALIAVSWFDLDYASMPVLLIISLSFWIPVLIMLYYQNPEVNLIRKNTKGKAMKAYWSVAPFVFSFICLYFYLGLGTKTNQRLPSPLDSSHFQINGPRMTVLFIITFMTILGAFLVFRIMSQEKEGKHE